MRRQVPDISKIRALIGFEPTLDIHGILEKVIAYHGNGVLSTCVGNIHATL